jgi:hypothetical protein
MEQNTLHILEQKLEELKRDKDVLVFKKKRALYADHFLDADKYEIEIEDILVEIQKVRVEIQNYLLQ